MSPSLKLPFQKSHKIFPIILARPQTEGTHIASRKTTQKWILSEPVSIFNDIGILLPTKKGRIGTVWQVEISSTVSPLILAVSVERILVHLVGDSN